MLKDLLLKYFYVWFQAHKRSKYAGDFSHHWYSGLLQVCLTAFFLLFNISILLEKLLRMQIVKGMNNIVFWIVYLIIPALCLYYILFKHYGVDKEDDDPIKFGISITKGTRVVSWIVFFAGPIFFALIFTVWK